MNVVVKSWVGLIGGFSVAVAALALGIWFPHGLFKQSSSANATGELVSFVGVFGDAELNFGQKYIDSDPICVGDGCPK